MKNENHYAFLDVDAESRDVTLEWTSNPVKVYDVGDEKRRYGGYFRKSTGKFYKSIRDDWASVEEYQEILHLKHKNTRIRSCYLRKWENVQDVLDRAYQDYPWIVKNISDRIGTYWSANQIGLFKTRHGLDGSIKVEAWISDSENYVLVRFMYYEYYDHTYDGRFKKIERDRDTILRGFCTTKHGFSQVLEEIRKECAERKIEVRIDKKTEKEALEIIEIMEAQAEARQAEA